MPPKKKGHTVAGKDQIFRHAVQHVRIGLGHAALGNLHLSLAAGNTSTAPAIGARGTSEDDSTIVRRPAFYLELNQQLLSHSSKDFKRFRWEILELCETVPLFHLHHRQLAHRLLQCLMHRGHSMSTPSATASQDDTETTEVGKTTEAYEAFARLSIAFARDMGVQFFAYFEVFQQAIESGMYDASGRFISDTKRLQLIFAVQAAWCRELKAYWGDPTQIRFVRRIVRVYIGQLHDTKEYVRRLSAELLSFLCRLCSSLLPLVVEEACGDILDSYAIAAAASPSTSASDAVEPFDSDVVGAEEESDDNRARESQEEEEETENGTHDSLVSALTSPWARRSSLTAYIRETLPHHPVMDGLIYFVAELFRGMRGALSSSFESHYVRLLVTFSLLSGGEDSSITSSPAVATRANDFHSVFQWMQRHHHPLAPFLEADSANLQPGADAEIHTSNMTWKEAHTTRWLSLFQVSAPAAAAETPESSTDNAEKAIATLCTEEDVQGALYLLRAMGSHAIGAALSTVMQETKKHSFGTRHRRRISGDEDGEDEEEDSDDGDGAYSDDDDDDDPGAAFEDQNNASRPAHRLLAAVVYCLEPQNSHHIHILQSLLEAAQFALWRDHRETALFRTIVENLQQTMRSLKEATQRNLKEVGEAGAKQNDILEYAAAVLQLVSPLCVVPPSIASRLLPKQQLFLPVGKGALAICRLFMPKEARGLLRRQEVLMAEAAQQILFAFAQDLLQKNYAYCLEQERRVAEELDTRDVRLLQSGDGGSLSDSHGNQDELERREMDYVASDAEESDGGNGTKTSSRTATEAARHCRIPSVLTPLALTLLHMIGCAVWKEAAEDLERETQARASSYILARSSSNGEDEEGRSAEEMSNIFHSVLRRRHIERAVLLCRLAEEHTQRMTVSPMQQLLRLKSMGDTATEKSNKKKKRPTEKSDSRTADLRRILESFAGQLLHFYLASSHWPSYQKEEALSYIACALPLIHILVQKQQLQVKSPTSAREERREEAVAPVNDNLSGSVAEVPLRELLLQLLNSIELVTTPEASASGSFSEGPAAYALYAEVAAMLVQLATGTSAKNSAASSSSASAHRRRGKTGRAGKVTDLAAVASEDGLRHLCRTVSLLARGFRNLRSTAAAASEAIPEAPTMPQHLFGGVIGASDAARARLLHGAEVLLRALLSLLDLDADGAVVKEEETRSGRGKDSLVGSGSDPVPPLPSRTRSALSMLRGVLPADLHGAFLSDILLETVTAPITSLRLVSLRLLRLLCHPSTPVAERLNGAQELRPLIMDSLLHAARFNPLSHTGNLDGIQQALSRVVFLVESGAVVAPWERVVLARAAVGMLYVKFSGAWAVALKIIAGLVAREQTSLLPHASQSAAGTSTSDGAAKESKQRQEPVVWNSVVCVTAPSLILGDFLLSRRGSDAAAPMAEAEGEDDTSLSAVEAVYRRYVPELMRQTPLYFIRFTDQQRHIKGELVSRAFSHVQYATASVMLVDLSSSDGEVLQWQQHWKAVEEGQRSSESCDAGTAVGALYATSTDRATLARVFLGGLEDMMKLSTAVDRKLHFVEDVVMELVAIQRNQHPSGVDPSRLKRLDERLELAMKACAAAPTSILSEPQQRRLSQPLRDDVIRRNEKLETVYLSYLSDTSARLQRVAVENLRRLRVQPFAAYYNQLMPYTAPMKTLFTALATFHLEGEVPVTDRLSFVSAALSLALPKLLSQVSKEKLKDQAVLSRRLLNFLDNLPTEPTAVSRASEAPRDPLAEVFDQLLHRLLFPGMVTGTTRGSALISVLDFDFLQNIWQPIVERRHDCGNSGARGIRGFERRLRQILSALRLLESMLHAVGQRFSVYVRSTLHLALQAYLVSSKQCLRAALEYALIAPSASASEEEVKQHRWALALAKALTSSTLSSSFAHVRKAAISVVTLLFEQFPEYVMNTLASEEREPLSSRKATSRRLMPSGCVEAHQSTTGSTALPLLGRYLTLVLENTKGMTRDGSAATAIGSRTQSAGYVTPLLRLLTAWVRSPALLPLFPAYAGVVIGTLQDVFAVSDTPASSFRGRRSAIHRASPQTVYEGLRCVADLLECADEVIRPLPMAAGAHVAPVTFRQSFLDQHIISVFTSLYTLLTSGAAQEAEAPEEGRGKEDVRGGVEEEAEEGAWNMAAAAATPASSASVSHHEEGKTSSKQRQRPGQRLQRSVSVQKRKNTVMSLSVAMWREVMRTTAQLSQYLHTSSDVDSAALEQMMSRLLQLSLRLVMHPVCIADSATAQMVCGVVQHLVQQIRQLDHTLHWKPLVHLFNVVTNPHARCTLCDTLTEAVRKLPNVGDSSTPGISVEVRNGKERGPCSPSQARELYQQQLAAAARAVVCLNSFENMETLERYDFELRYHTLYSLQDFFTNYGNYGALPRGGRAGRQESNGPVGSDGGNEEHHEKVSGPRGTATSAVWQERTYDGEQDVRLPLDKDVAPVLAVDAVALLSSNVMFFLRDPEQTIRVLAGSLLQAMLRYAAHGGRPLPNAGERRRRGKIHMTEEDAREASQQLPAVSTAIRTGLTAAQEVYQRCLLDTVLRHEVLSSLRRGIVAKDIHIRCAHMQNFEGFARYFAPDFPSFALLYSPNPEQNFYSNVGHVQHRCRLHALSLLRQHAATMQVRDLLRVFVPFLISAVKDFAEGKRDQANTTEGRARGYSDAVLLTVSTIASRLPWVAYYRVLSLFLSNASANASLRGTMLRGIVQILDTFHYLGDDDAEEKKSALTTLAGSTAENDDYDDDDDDEGPVEDDDAMVMAEVRAKQRQYRHARVMQTLESDVLPQLYSYIGDKETSKTVGGAGLMGQHSISAIRREQAKADTAQMRTALLQLPVAMAITKIVKHFPDDRFHVHVELLLDELIKKLRTKNDKHRERARRILGAMLQEAGPSKLRFVVTKLKDNLVHGYQLHVLGYTVVTLLYQLYDPGNKLLQQNTNSHDSMATGQRGFYRGGPAAADVVQDALEEAQQAHRRRRIEATSSSAQPAERVADRNGHAGGSDAGGAIAVGEDVDEDTAVEIAERALLKELAPSHASFDYHYGVQCLTNVLDDLLLIFLDDYLGEVGVQKEQVEVMSTMVEVKRNRALQGFAFLAKHCDAATVTDAFLHRMTWVLTPPSDTSVNVEELHGSAKARALLANEMQNKYLNVTKNSSADLVFVNKVRLLSVRVARSLMTNPTMSVERSFQQVRDLLEKHNNVREEKIKAFEAKDGTRRIRGNAHMIISKAERRTRKEQLDRNFLVAAVPERVDVDFSAHTVLATQQKQKLRIYRGRYGKEVKEAAKDFYREDPVTAVVLDTLDEFLLKLLLSVLKQVLGIGKEKHYSKAAMKLDVLRHRRERSRRKAVEREEEEGDGMGDDEEDDEATTNGDKDATMAVAEEENDDENDGDDDGIGAFAEAQAEADGAADSKSGDGCQPSGSAAKQKGSSVSTSAAAMLAVGSDLTLTFTQEHRELLESLVPTVLSALQGEGSDSVVANAMDCLLALVSLRPPLDAVKSFDTELFDTVTSFIQRGSVIKQRAIRLTAAVVAHQKYVLSESSTTQLVKLVRAEVMERTSFMPASLGLLYAVLGKHVHVVEIYDLMDVITELLLHWSGRRGIRRRCIIILVRFLMEFRLTREKFRSHMDLLCRNLDYPELTGRIAIMELLDALIVRLPAVVLREEAPMLLVPLAAAVTSSEWVECRQQAGVVLRHLARYAGVDVLVPILSSWMAPKESRPTRTMGAQTWAAMLPELQDFYELSAKHHSSRQESDDGEEIREHREVSFHACCAWSIEPVLQGCVYDQVLAAGRNKKLGQLATREKETVEMKGWAYIFYSLRCMETMLVALPNQLYPLLAPRLLPHLVEVLVLHIHPWVRAVATRILRHYFYVYVESVSAYMQDVSWQQKVLAATPADDEDVDGDAPEEEQVEKDGAMMYVFTSPPLAMASSSAKKPYVLQAFIELDNFATLVKRLLGAVSNSDVAMETYTAHRAIGDPTRAELLKTLIYALKAMSQLSLYALALSAPYVGFSREVQRRVYSIYALVRRQLASQVSPIVQQDSILNYMVRSATLIQLLGGWISVMPLEMPTEEEEEAEAEGHAAGAVMEQQLERYNQQVRWLLQGSLCPTAFLQECVIPLLLLGLRCQPVSTKIFTFAHQATDVVEQQLEQRRLAFTTAIASSSALPLPQQSSATSKKRRRDLGSGVVVNGEEGSLKRRRVVDGAKTVVTSASDVSGCVVPLDDFLVQLKTGKASLAEVRRQRQITEQTTKAMKRNRHIREMENRGHNSIRGGRGSGARPSAVRRKG